MISICNIELSSSVAVFHPVRLFNNPFLEKKNHFFTMLISRGFALAEKELRTVPTIVIAHTFCASRDTRVPIGDAY